MPINKYTKYGNIKISDSAISVLVGSTVCECYGVVGVTSQNLIVDGINELLGKENYSKGVIVKNKNNILEFDLYIVVGLDVKIPTVVTEIQKRIKYIVEKSLNMDVGSVNVHIEGMKGNNDENY